MRRLAALFVVFAAASALASQPGQPLDCSDWQYSEPGLSCENVSSFPCVDADFSCSLEWQRNPLSVEGDFFEMRQFHTDAPPCTLGGGPPLETVEVVRRDRYGTATTLAHLESRCDGVNMDRVEACVTVGNQPRCLLFDPHNGVLYAYLQIYHSGGPLPYPSGSRVLAISGFATTFDLRQSFVPDKQTLGLHVPARPEGLSATTGFDSYWGAITQPLDLANAHPLQCAYPPTPPMVGDYLQITAPVPTPTPGSANYVLTSVTFQGQTRAGRKASGGRLTGRDASRLPACVIE